MPFKQIKRSSYANKRPHRYSTLFNQWRAALMSGKSDEASELGQAHTRMWLGDDGLVRSSRSNPHA